MKPNRAAEVMAGGAAAVALGIVLLVVSPRMTAAGPPIPADPFAACRQRLAQHPGDYESAYCFYAAAFERRSWSQGIRVFEALMREHADNFWLPLAFGHLHRNRNPGADLAAAETLYRRAADGFQRQRHAEGEILARSNLRDILFPTGRVAEATAEVSRVTSIGAAVVDPIVKARVWMMEAGHVLDTGGDLGLVVPASEADRTGRVSRWSVSPPADLPVFAWTRRIPCRTP